MSRVDELCTVGRKGRSREEVGRASGTLIRVESEAGRSGTTKKPETEKIKGGENRQQHSQRERKGCTDARDGVVRTRGAACDSGVFDRSPRSVHHHPVRRLLRSFIWLPRPRVRQMAVTAACDVERREVACEAVVVVVGAYWPGST